MIIHSLFVEIYELFRLPLSYKPVNNIFLDCVLRAMVYKPFCLSILGVKFWMTVSYFLVSHFIIIIKRVSFILPLKHTKSLMKKYTLIWNGNVYWRRKRRRKIIYRITTNIGNRMSSFLPIARNIFTVKWCNLKKYIGILTTALQK